MTTRMRALTLRPWPRHSTQAAASTPTARRHHLQPSPSQSASVRSFHGRVLPPSSLASSLSPLLPLAASTRRSPPSPSPPPPWAWAAVFTRGYQPGRLYAGQDASRQNEKKFSELSGKLPWEPEMRFLEGIKRDWSSPEPNLNELIREDLPLARQLFRNVLQQHYRQDMGMWNKWACMEWKVANYDLARMVFTKAAKISFHAELWQSWASMERETRNFREARRLFNVILATDPGNATASLSLALLEADVGQHAAARQRFQALVRDHGDDVLVLQAAAVFEARVHNLTAARELFRVASEHPQASAQVWHAWGKAEYDCGLYRNALMVLMRGMQRFPTHKWLIQLSAMAHYQLGDVYEARRAFQRLVAGGLFVEPSSYHAYATMEEQLGFDDVAQALYTEALRHHPEHTPSAMALARLHHRLGHMDRARRVFEQTLARLQDKHHPVQHVADLMQAWGSFEESDAHEYAHARELYEEVTRQCPTHGDAWKALARVESRLGHVEAARTVLTLASQHLAADAPLLVELAKLEQRQRRFGAARRAYEKALKLDPSRASVWNLRAVMELSLDPARARDLVETALGIIPDEEKKSWAILLCTYGRAFAALQEPDKAVAAFQRSFKLAPKNWETHAIYADTVLQPHGAWKEALKHLVAARRLLPRGDRRRGAIEKKIKVVEDKLAEMEEETDGEKEDRGEVASDDEVEEGEREHVEEEMGEMEEMEEVGRGR